MTKKRTQSPPHTTPTPLSTSSTSTSTTTSTFSQLVDRDEVSHQIRHHLNAIFEADASNLGRVKDLIRDLEAARQDLQQRLQFTTTAAPDKITRAVKAAETALDKSASLVEESGTLQTLVAAHREEVAWLLEAVGENVRKVSELERVEEYQALVSTVEEWSHDISSALHIGAEGQALVGYTRVVGVAATLKETQCRNLRVFVSATLIHWNKALLQRFVKEFEGVLKNIKWPLSDDVGGGGGAGGAGGVGGAVGGGPCQPPPPPEAVQRLCTLTQYLLQLSLPEDVTPPEEDCPPSPTVAPPPLLSKFDPPLLPIQLLLNPLQVRFLYHFSGGRATNSRSHPEWYFIQLLKWAGSHEHLLTHRLQPVLERSGREGVSAKVEFLRGLVRLAAIKLTSHLKGLSLDEDDLFAHVIQETLHFERELCSCHGYPGTQPSILCVLTDPSVFQRWLALERKFAMEVMDELVSADGAWETDFCGGGGGAGGGETARCGEQVILLLQGITDRYKRLPQPGHRLQFLELQLDLLDDFRVRLLQVRQTASRDPLTSAFPTLLNTAHHLSSTLADWADLPFFVEMEYYRENFYRTEVKASTTITTLPPSSPSSPSSIRQRHPPPPPSSSSSTGTSSSSSSSSPPPPPPPQTSSPSKALSSASPGTPEHLGEQPAPPTSAQLAEVSGSVFDSVRTLFTHMEGEMVHTLAMYVFSEVRARSQPYRRDRWHRTQADAHTDTDAHERRRLAVKISEASPSICPLLEVLARHLLTLRDTLATPLFHRLWVEVADTLDKYVLEEVVLETRFSHLGAHQFKFDMTRALFPIFGEFTQRPDNYFRRIKESTVLLTLPLATVLLLQDAITASGTVPGESAKPGGAGGLAVAPRRALGEHGVSVLTPGEAAAVMNARIFDLE